MPLEIAVGRMQLGSFPATTNCSSERSSAVINAGVTDKEGCLLALFRSAGLCADLFVAGPSQRLFLPVRPTQFYKTVQGPSSPPAPPRAALRVCPSAVPDACAIHNANGQAAAAYLATMADA